MPQCHSERTHFKRIRLMKAIYLLLIVLLFSCVERDRRWHYPSPEESRAAAALSDIASEVVAIPLETPGRYRISQIEQVKRDGNHLFVVSNRKLFHYNRQGKFLNPIDTPEDSLYVRDYVVDTDNRQLLVLDYRQSIHYYTYTGEHIDTKYLGKHPWNTLYRLAYFDKHLWATAETFLPDPDNPSRQRIEKWLYRFDLSLNTIEGSPVEKVDLGRPDYSCGFQPEIGVINNKVYVHCLSMQPDYLLRDTLHLINNHLLEPPLRNGGLTEALSGEEGLQAYPIRQLPVRLHHRFLIASSCNSTDKDLNYIFCYDREEREAYKLPDGFRDNFYETGYVADMHPLSLYSDEYYYCKKGSNLPSALPGTCDETPILFILRLKA